MVASATSSVCTAKLLVVEDDDSIRETVEEALRAEGFEVRACGDGAEAMNLLTATDSMGVDLLVLDLMLPGLGGLDLCRQLRKLNNNTPVLVISARDSETDRVLGLEVGADDYLVKPFGLRELVARCRALLLLLRLQGLSVLKQDQQPFIRSRNHDRLQRNPLLLPLTALRALLMTHAEDGLFKLRHRENFFEWQSTDQQISRKLEQAFSLGIDVPDRQIRSEN